MSNASGSFPSRLEHFAVVDSTQHVVRAWLDAGTPEVCVATADVQTAGRGRQGRSWTAPSGTALMASAGFRPGMLPLAQGWRLGAIVALAMVDAAEETAGLKDGTLWLKWPNDLVAVADDGGVRKLAGVLGESSALGATVETAIVGIGVNVDWPASAFPPELAGTMTSLRELSGGRSVDRDALLDAWLARLEPRYESLRAGRFDAGGWSSRQLTTAREVVLELGSGDRLTVTAMGVDPDSGALLVAGAGDSVVAIASAEVVRCRLAGAV